MSCLLATKLASIRKTLTFYVCHLSFQTDLKQEPSEIGLSCSRWSFLQDRDATATDTFQIHLNIRLGSPLSATGAGRQQQLPPAPLIKIQREKPTCCYKTPWLNANTTHGEPSAISLGSPPLAARCGWGGGSDDGAWPGEWRSRFLTTLTGQSDAQGQRVDWDMARNWPQRFSVQTGPSSAF